LARLVGADHLLGSTTAGAVSTNWSGYAATGGGPYKSVVTSWIQPSVTCSGANQYAAFWDGLDGYSDGTVEQTGSIGYCARTRSSRSRSYTPEYYAWYEMYPAAMVAFSNTVRPGDELTATVTGTTGGSFVLTLNDSTQNWTRTVSATLSNPGLSSAEVIAEAPSSGASILPLANFGTVNFSGALVNGAAMATLPSSQLQSITMESNRGALEAQPGAITGTSSAGSSFSDTWASL
jgi:hypothetical protein